MRLRVLLEPRYGASYAQILAMARAAEEAGFDAFFRSDHYLGIDPSDASYAPTDSWATLAGLAVQTQRIRLGTLMTASTFRYPGPLAVTVGTVDAMSGGRVELGIGAAWYEREHQAFGIPFPATGERFDRLEEQLSILAGLWSTPPGERFSYRGKHYQLAECANFPVLAQVRGADAGPPELVDVTSGPLEGTRCHIDTRADTDDPRAHVGAPAFPAGLPRPRLIIGGAGPRRTPALAARFADEFNSGFRDGIAERFANFRRVCAGLGRDPATVRLSTTFPVCCGATAAEAARRAGTLGEAGARLLRQGVVGRPADVLQHIEELAAAGVDTLYFHIYDAADTDHIRLLGRDVLPEAS
jgi:alkanesulfonate monooxygenase SsuD/methylene tetrahydromethanopterin reductase-like flavin-dependent oxidoreductase (luciferase family)